MFYALFDIISIGIPFCIFKFAAGFFYEQSWLLWLGIIDLLINVINLFIILIKKEKKFDTCLLAFIVRIIFKAKAGEKSKWQDLGESFDVALSFIIVAVVIGSGDIAGFPPELTTPWNWAVVFNVLGAGSVRVLESIRSLKH